MLVLGLETTGEVCGIALADQTGLLGASSFPHEMQLSQRLIGEVEEALRIAGVTLQDIDGFGVDIGPGSFTGVRVGVTTVKVWARVLNKPVVGICSLDAIGDAEGTTITMIRARAGTVYARIFQRENGAILDESDPEVVEPAILIGRLAQEGVTACLFAGPGVSGVTEELIRAAQEFGIEATLRPDWCADAETIALKAVAAIRAGIVQDPLTLEPLYVQPPAIRTK